MTYLFATLWTLTFIVSVVLDTNGLVILASFLITVAHWVLGVELYKHMGLHSGQEKDT